MIGFAGVSVPLSVGLGVVGSKGFGFSTLDFDFWEAVFRTFGFNVVFDSLAGAARLIMAREMPNAQSRRPSKIRVVTEPDRGAGFFCMGAFPPGSAGCWLDFVTRPDDG